MPRFDQPKRPTICQLRFSGVHTVRQLGAGENTVERQQQIMVIIDRFTRRGDFGR
jgi:hypothetical protein